MSTGDFGMSTSRFTIFHFAILPVPATFWEVGGSFWHVDWRFGHVHESIYYFSLYYSSCPSYFLASWGVVLACRLANLACRRVDLLFLTLLFFLSQFSFLVSRGVVLACRRAILACPRVDFMFHFKIFLSQLIFWQVGGSFWHVDGRFWHVHESIYYFSLYYSSCPNYFLASRGVV